MARVQTPANPWSELDLWLGADLVVPDIIEFCLSDKYLRRRLYPRQGTLLKLITLSTEAMTQYDYDVIGEWTEEFTRTDNHGVQPDILERLAINKAKGLPWFTEVVGLIGRRGSKGFIGGAMGSFVIWNYLAMFDPQSRFGIDRDKRLTAMVFATKKGSAMANQWKDLVDMVKGAKCFERYLPQSPPSESLRIFAPNDFLRIRERQEAGIFERPENLATFEILPKESAASGARGYTVFMEMFDEYAYVTREVSKSSSEELWTAAKPALDQFKEWAWIYEPSTTWQKIGQLYQNYESAFAISDGKDGYEAGEILHPQIMCTQLESWDPYKDWEIADQIPLYPGDRQRFIGSAMYPKQTTAPQEYDDEMKREELRDPENFRVERRSNWASVLDAYFTEEAIERVFEPWPPPPHVPVNERMHTSGPFLVEYIGHADPAKVNANFALAMAHVLYTRDSPLPHVVFDLVTYWSAADFVPITGRHEIDYNTVLGDIKDLLTGFAPSQFTFDQGYSNWMIQLLRQWVPNLARPCQVFERTANAQINWKVAETTKVAMNLGLIHCPPDGRAAELLKDELSFMQLITPPGGTMWGRVDHPSSGPVQTSDCYDAFSNVIYSLIGKQVADMIGQQLMGSGISGGQAGGLPLSPFANQPSGNENMNENPMVAQLKALSRRGSVTNLGSQPMVKRTAGRPIGPRGSGASNIARRGRWR